MVCIKKLNEDIEIVKSIFKSTHECFQFIDRSKSYLRMRFIVDANNAFTFTCSLPYEYPRVKPVWFVENATKPVLTILKELAEDKNTDDMDLIKQVNILLTDLGSLFNKEVQTYVDELNAVVLTEDLVTLALVACECPACEQEAILLGACGSSETADSDWSKPRDMPDGPTGSATFHSKKEGAANRLMRELNNFYHSDSYFKGLFEVTLVNDSLFVWQVDLHCIDEGSMLAKDLELLKNQGHDGFIKLQVHFSNNYPYKPPFVRVIYPHITGGFVLGGGVFCIDLLSARNWKSVYSVESVLVQIGALLGNSNARVSKNGVKLAAKEYTFESARETQLSIETFHERTGWRNKKI